jgi:hypothetical protein
MKKVLAALLGAVLAVGAAQAATPHAKHKRQAARRTGDTVMSLTRPKTCSSYGAAKRSVGCMAPAVAARDEAPDTTIMGNTGERHAAHLRHHARN